jgi:hypothetical protein
MEPLTPQSIAMLFFAAIGFLAVCVSVVGGIVFAIAGWLDDRSGLSAPPMPATTEQLERLRAMAADRAMAARATQRHLSTEERRRITARIEADKARQEQDRVRRSTGTGFLTI